MLAGAVMLLAGWPAPASASVPAPCGGAAGITDDAGDGHHANTDVLSAWLSEEAGRLQAVVKVTLGDWGPAHEDSDAAAWALLFDAGGQTRFVRVVGPRSDAPRYDFGAWTPASGFASGGATTGAVVAGFGGTATIDVPAATGASAGAVLARLFVLTYDGGTRIEPHWVDRAPGGVRPVESAFGADYVVGSCGSGLPGGPGSGPGESPGGPGAAVTTTALSLDVPRRVVGGGRVQASGRVAPARGGVSVLVTASPRNSNAKPVTRTATTLTDGSFSASLPIAETSRVNAVAEAINAGTRSVTVRSTVRMAARRLAGGRTSVSGTVSPRLPGRALLLRADAVVASARATVSGGRFRFRARTLRPGRYQVVFIPSGNRAERSTSRSGAIR